MLPKSLKMPLLHHSGPVSQRMHAINFPAFHWLQIIMFLSSLSMDLSMLGVIFFAKLIKVVQQDQSPVGKQVGRSRQGLIYRYIVDGWSRSNWQYQLHKQVNGKRSLTSSWRVDFFESYNVDRRLTQPKNIWLVKEVINCNCEAESCIDIFKPMVTDSSHWIIVVLASINIKGCRTSWLQI